MMSYTPWLVAISLAFLLLERLFPWRKGQPLLRRGWVRDLGFLALNGRFFSAWMAALNGAAALAATRGLRALGLGHDSSPAAEWPLAAQFLAFLVLADFLQWCIHNLLHRVPWLWTFHKVHHSIDTMDWIGNWRFHWMEVVVYKTLQWVPLAWLDASPQAVLAVAVVTTVWGDFNHANLDLGLGPLGYVINNPRMHLWHHDRSTEGGAAKNFGIVLSVWDFLFGTAYWPRGRSPQQLGYPDMEEMPATFPGQVLWPLTRARRAREDRAMVLGRAAPGALRSAFRLAAWLPGQRLPAASQEVALGGVVGPLDRSLVRRPRLGVTAQAAQEVGADGVEEVTGAEVQRVDEGESHP